MFLCRVCHLFQDIDTYPDYKLVELYRSTKDLHEQSQSLKYLLDRCGPDHVVDGNTIRDLLETIRFSASQTANQDWLVIHIPSQSDLFGMSRLNLHVAVSD